MDDYPPLYYILDEDGRTPVPVARDDFLVWAEWMSDARKNNLRVVQQTKYGSTLVSTVFLGIDHSFSMVPHTPVLFETMIFPSGGFAEDYQERYATWEQAEAGHKKACEIVERRRSLWGRITRLCDWLTGWTKRV